MLRLDWSPRALKDIRRLYGFLWDKSPRTANRAIETIRTAANQLRDFPETGRPAADSTVGHRELIVPFSKGGYVVAYLIRADAVEILDIRHQREAGY